MEDRERTQQMFDDETSKKIKELSEPIAGIVRAFYHLVIFLLLISLAIILLSKLGEGTSNKIKISNVEYVNQLQIELFVSFLYWVIEHVFLIWAITHVFLYESRKAGIVTVSLLIFHTFFGPYFLGNFLLTDCIIQGFALKNSTFGSCFNATSLQNYSSIMDCIFFEGKAIKKCVCSIDLLRDSYFKYAFLMFLENLAIIGIGALMRICIKNYLKDIEEIIQKSKQ